MTLLLLLLLLPSTITSKKAAAGRWRSGDASASALPDFLAVGCLKKILTVTKVLERIVPGHTLCGISAGKSESCQS